MIYKKIIINFVVITLAFILFVVWHQFNFIKSKQTSMSLIPFYTVYLVTVDQGFRYWGILNQGAADMAELIGINYIWEAPEVRSTERQIEIINEAVLDGANALLIAADDPKEISGPVEDAKARGVKVIYVDTPAYEEAITTLATDNYEAGVIAAQTMLRNLDEAGVESGSIGIVNLADKENTRLREVGFREMMELDERFNLIETIYTALDRPEVTQEAAEQIIAQNPDLVGLFGTSEGTSLGVGYANRANDKRYVTIGFDLTDVSLPLLEDGSFDALIDQNPYTMGYLGMAEAVAAILGKETGPEFINTGVTVVESYP